MSDQKNRVNRDFSVYDAMETAELEEILRLDAEAPEGEESDLELILHVMEVLADRRRRNGSFTGKTAEEAYESFIQHYLPEVEEPENSDTGSGKPIRRHALCLRRLMAAAAVIVIVLFGSMTAKAFGFDVWKIVAIWAQETFHLGKEGQTDVDGPRSDDGLEYESLLDVMTTENDAPDVVPTWIPDGFELSVIDIFETPTQKKYVALYINGKLQLRVIIQSYLDTDPEQMEQSEGFLGIYQFEGIDYYLFSNHDIAKAAWINGNYECYISGELTIEELKTMIDSIGKG